LHTDIGNNFVKAIDARTGKALGKDHKLKHRDAIEIATKIGFIQYISLNMEKNISKNGKNTIKIYGK
jgi:hypothetical protein